MGEFPFQGHKICERRDIMMEKQKRMVLLDWLKAGSILCIIINHTDLLGRGIPANYMLNCLVVAMAVPVFMIISGYNMANSYIVNGRDAGGV